jgi:hypothetical protein
MPRRYLGGFEGFCLRICLESWESVSTITSEGKNFSDNYERFPA